MSLLGLSDHLVVFLDMEKSFEVANPSAILEAFAEKGVRAAEGAQ